mmetsp:Transcript_13408/g.30964  ORF Transcript_13408/g.30964 Transcript_13408/m.30964 type:complete len:111 (-) Transcript_13408:19-351(-)
MAPFASDLELLNDAGCGSLCARIPLVSTKNKQITAIDIDIDIDCSDLFVFGRDKRDPGAQTATAGVVQQFEIGGERSHSSDYSGASNELICSRNRELSITRVQYAITVLF